MNTFVWLVFFLLFALALFIIFRVYHGIKRDRQLDTISKRLEVIFPDMIVILNDMFHVMRILHFNPKIFPYDEDTLMDVNLWGILSAEVASQIYKSYKTALTTGKRTTAILRFEPYERRKSIKMQFIVIRSKKQVVCFVSETDE